MLCSQLGPEVDRAQRVRTLLLHDTSGESDLWQPLRTELVSLYVRCLVGFLSGEVASKDREDLTFFFDRLRRLCENEAQEQRILSSLRARAIENLILDREPAARAYEWQQLTVEACQHLWERSFATLPDRIALLRGQDHPSTQDRRFEVPVAYIECESADDIRRALEWIETTRVEKLSLTLQRVPPSLEPPESEAASALLKRESALLSKLRAARFAVLLPGLPIHYRRLQSEIDEGFSPRLNLDERHFSENFNACWQDLRSLHEEMVTVLPEYAATRKEPRADFQAFLACVRDSKPDRAE